MSDTPERRPYPGFLGGGMSKSERIRRADELADLKRDEELASSRRLSQQDVSRLELFASVYERDDSAHKDEWRARAKAVRHALHDLRVVQKERNRAVWIATHLFGMVPREVWRDQGGDDQQGHYEGEYWAEKIEDELAALSEPEEPR